MRIFYVWLNNLTDSRDDDVAKVRAKDREDAKFRAQVTRTAFSSRWRLGPVYTAAQFREEHLDWWHVMKGVKAS